jgi:hypothetical protein
MRLSLFLAGAIAFTFFYLSFLLVDEALAQNDDRWSLPRQIPDYDRNGRAPFLIADKNRTVHAFNVQSVREGEGSLYYRQWSIDRGWTIPVDIILPPRVGSFSVEDVVLDHNGIFHLIFFVGDNITGGIYYSKAYAAVAGRAQSWSQPAVIGEAAGPVGSAVMVERENGELVVVYAGRQDGIGLYEVLSYDEGENWTRPQAVALSFEEDLFPNGLGIVKDTEDRLHLVWSLVNIRGLGEGIYYTSHLPGKASWRVPISLALLEENDYSTNWPSIAIYRDQLLVIYQDSRPATRWMRQSLDSGTTWTAPERLFPHEGEYEFAVLREDSAGILHIVLGNRFGNPAIHGMWHSRWTGQRWTVLEPIVSGPKTSRFDPSAPTAVISQGNVLLVSWWNDASGPDRTGAWFSFKQLNSPEQPLEVLPEAKLEPTSIPVEVVVIEPLTETPVLTPLPDINLDFAHYDVTRNPAIPIAAATVPAASLISLVIAGYFLIKRKPNHK